MAFFFCSIKLGIVIMDCVKTIDQNLLQMVIKFRETKDDLPPLILVLNKV